MFALNLYGIPFNCRLPIFRYISGIRKHFNVALDNVLFFASVSESKHVKFAGQILSEYVHKNRHYIHRGIFFGTETMNFRMKISNLRMICDDDVVYKYTDVLSVLIKTQHTKIAEMIQLCKFGDHKYQLR